MRIREGMVAETKEISEGVVFANYAANGSLSGVELLAPCDLAILNQLAENEPEPVKRFLKRGVRMEMIGA